MPGRIWGDYDQAALDRAYNARESVPDFEVYLRGFDDDSARARAANPGPRDVAYGPHRDQVLDVFPAKGAEGGGKPPLHLFIHGGYWRLLTKDETSFAAAALAPAGATVLVNSYSLCPDVHLDVIVRQCRDAVAWACGNPDAHGGDPERITISGHSAGGHLVGMMLATDWEGEYGLPKDVIKGATAISGIFDMRPMRLAFTQEWIELTEAAAHRNSPLFQLPTHDCPVIVSWGGEDPKGFREQARAYVEALEKHGNPVTVIELPGKDHFAAGNQLMDRDSPLTAAIIRQMGL